MQEVIEKNQGQCVYHQHEVRVVLLVDPVGKANPKLKAHNFSNQVPGYNDACSLTGGNALGPGCSCNLCAIHSGENGFKSVLPLNVDGIGKRSHEHIPLVPGFLHAHRVKIKVLLVLLA